MLAVPQSWPLEMGSHLPLHFLGEVREALPLVNKANTAEWLACFMNSSLNLALVLICQG